MNREFLEHYDRELKLLYERSKEFAEEYPGVAERLGGLVEGQMDPGLVGVLEGSAFMAARVQLKLKSEFDQFTTTLLEQILPNYLAPIASTGLVQAVPNYEDPDLIHGNHFKSGSYIDAVYVEQERRISCRYRICSDLSMWPLHLESAEYCASPAPLQALGLEIASGVLGGLKLSFKRLSAKPTKKKASKKKRASLPVSQCEVDELPVHITTVANDAVMLYEQLFSNCVRITFRYTDEFGDPKFIAAPSDMLQQIGFGEDDRLFDADDRNFNGFDLLREFFSFPGKFLGFKLTGLQKVLKHIDADAFDVLFEFDTVASKLTSTIKQQAFAVYAVPITNLFELNCSRVRVNRNEHEHHVVPDRSRPLDFEAHKIIDVFAHYPNSKQKVRVYPLYSLPTGNTPIADALYYTFRRLPRRKSTQERRFGAQSSYVGTEIFLSLNEPVSIDEKERVREISVRCLASNRHLADQLPVGSAGADFFFTDDTSVTLQCISGPTPPRESLIHLEHKKRDAAPSGRILWRLINLLNLNHLGLIDRNSKEGAGTLRELLSIFADISESVTERQIRGILNIESRPIVRRMRQANGFHAARGIEITVTMDEKAFEGSGIFLLGAALDRFFAEYSSLNSFTETVIKSKQRGIIKRWPPRSGTGLVL